MRALWRLVAALALSLAGWGGALAGTLPADPAGPPRRVMSLNLCTDQLVLALLPAERIASVTWLARDQDESYLAGLAGKVPVNYGLVEEVLAQKPDLVLAGSYTTPVTRALLKRLGYPMLEVEPANSFAEIRTVTRKVAAALGEVAKGEALLADMDRELAELGASQPAYRPRIIAWDGGGYSPGEGTLYDEILRVAGARNIAADAGMRGFGSIDIENLMQSAPDLLLQGARITDEQARRTELARHPFVRAHYADRRVAIPQSLYSCGTPMSADAARRLRAALLEKREQGPRPAMREQD